MSVVRHWRCDGEEQVDVSGVDGEVRGGDGGVTWLLKLHTYQRVREKTQHKFGANFLYLFCLETYVLHLDMLISIRLRTYSVELMNDGQLTF
jgi:hypothetical protein